MLQYLVQNILDYAQIKAGKLRKNLECFNVKDIVEKVMNIQNMQATSKNIYLEAEYNLDNYNVKTDPKRFAQVLLILQSNALKFTFEGGVKLKFDKID